MPVELNGLLHHNLSTETHPVPTSHYDLEAIRLQARLHDENGYDKVLAPNAARLPDNISLAGYVGALTQNLGIMLAHRPGFIAPTMAARMFATLDHMLRGNLGIHIITGASDVELQADGDFLTKDVRYERSGEYIDVMRRMWTEDKVDFDGRFYKVVGGHAEVKPIQPNGPQIYFGGMSQGALDVASRFADTFATLSDTVAGMTEVVGKVRPAAQAQGRDPRFLMSIRLVLGDTEAQAWADADAIKDRIAANMPNLEVNRLAAQAADGFKRSAELAARGDRLEKCFWNGINALRGGQSNSGALVGTPDQIVDALMDYYDAGVSKFIIRGFEIADIERIGKEVIPRMRAKVAERDAA